MMMDKLRVFIIWIWIQEASSQIQKTNVILLDQYHYPNDLNLLCAADEIIVIDDILCSNSYGKLCSAYTSECQATQEVRYIIHENCSTKKGNCLIRNISNQATVCENSIVTTDRLVVKYSCVPGYIVFDICSNFTKSLNNRHFLTLWHGATMSHEGCICALSSPRSDFFITVKEIRLYDDSRHCTSSSVIIWTPGQHDPLDTVCNDTQSKWPNYSTFLGHTLKCRASFIKLENIEGQIYPSVLIEVKAHTAVNVSCRTTGTHEKPLLPTTISIQTLATTSSSVSPQTTKWLSSSLSIHQTTKEPLKKTTSMASNTSSDGEHESPQLARILLIGAGFVVVVVLAVMTACYMYRRKRKPEIDFAETGHPYFMSESNETPKQTPKNRSHNQSRHCKTNNGDVKKLHKSNANTKGFVPFSQDNAELPTMPVTKPILDEKMVSNYDCIDLQSTQPTFDDTKYQVRFSYEHCTNWENQLNVDKDNYATVNDIDDMYNNLDEEIFKPSGNQDMDPYDHVGDQSNAFGKKIISRTNDLEETYSHLIVGLPMIGFPSQITCDENDYSHVQHSE